MSTIAGGTSPYLSKRVHQALATMNFPYLQERYLGTPSPSLAALYYQSRC